MKLGKQTWTWQHTVWVTVVFASFGVGVWIYLAANPDIPLAEKIFFGAMPFLAALGMYVCYLLDRPLE